MKVSDMVKIAKRNGEMEEFSREKLIRSMRIAGASEVWANEIAYDLPLIEGISTAEIREFVIQELKKRNPAIARHYERTITFVVREIKDSIVGIAKFSKMGILRLKVVVGNLIHLNHDDKSCSVHVEEANIPDNEIHLSPKEISLLDVEVPDKITIHRSENASESDPDEA